MVEIFEIFLDDRFMKGFKILIALFGLFVLYQIILKILGHSWTYEIIVLTVLTIVATFTISNSVNIAKLKSDVDYVKSDLNNLKADFRNMDSNIRRMDSNISEMRIDIKMLTKEVGALKSGA